LKVKELIELLKQYPSNMTVIIKDGITSFKEVKKVESGEFFQHVKDFRKCDDGDEENSILIG